VFAQAHAGGDTNASAHDQSQARVRRGGHTKMQLPGQLIIWNLTMNRLAVLICLMIQYDVGLSQKKPSNAKLIEQSFFRIIPGDSIAFTKIFSSSIAEKTIIGFGEATHGTREFRQGFVKMAKDLIQHGGINVVLLGECGFSDTYYLNEFVVYGRECPLKFNKNQSVIDEDFKDFAVWLRNYNNQLKESDRVWLLGSDILFLNSVSQDVLTLSDELNIKLSGTALAMLNEFTFIGDQYKRDYFDHRVLRNMTQTADSIIKQVTAATAKTRLSFRQNYLLQSTSNLKSSIQISEWMSNYSIPRFGNAYNERDSCIFKNIQWVLAMKPNAKIILFAQNAHIEKDYGNISLKMNVRLGHLLKAKLGQEYFAIGTEVGRGEFVYKGKISERKDRIGNFFHEAGLGEGVLLFNQPQLNKQFSRKYTMTYGNSGARTANIAYYNNTSAAYDAIYYFPNSTLSTPLASRDPFEDFILTVPMGSSHHLKFGIHRRFILKVKSEFVLENNPCDGKSISLSVLFLSKEGKLTDFASLRLSSGQTGEYRFKIPANAESALVTIAGRGVQSINISKFEIDGIGMDPEEAQFSAKQYNRRNLTGEIMITRKGM